MQPSLGGGGNRNGLCYDIRKMGKVRRNDNSRCYEKQPSEVTKVIGMIMTAVFLSEA